MRRLSLSVLVLVTSLATTAMAGQSAEKIVLSAQMTPGGPFDVFAMNPDGSGQTNLTMDFDGNVGAVAISPDGRRLAFATQGTSSALWCMNADGSNKTLLRQVGNLMAVRWYDNDTIAYDYVIGSCCAAEIRTIKVDGSNDCALIPVPFVGQMTVMFFDLSPDRSQIAVDAQISNWSPTTDIYLADVTGPCGVTNGRMFYGDAGDNELDRFPLWSHDGQTLYWAHDWVPGVETPKAIVKKSLNSSQSVTEYDALVRPACGYGSTVCEGRPCALSPDDSRLLFVEDGGAHLYILDLVGATENMLLTAQSLFDADWGLLHVGPEPQGGWPMYNGGWNNTRCYPGGSQGPSSHGCLHEQWSAPGGPIVTGDVNGDGELEVATATGTTMAVRKADGTLLWSTTSAYTIDQVVLDDVTGDGRPDVLICGRGSGATYDIRAYRGYDGLLLKTIPVDVSGDENVQLRGVYDLDNDGDLEVVITRNSGYSLLRRGLWVYDYETGAEVWGYEIGPGTSNQDVVVADVNGDGELELLLGSAAVHNGKCANGYCDSGSWLFCFGYDGTLRWATPLGDWKTQSSVADIDDDGVNEIIVFQGGDYYPGNVFAVRELRGTDGAIMQTWLGPPDTGVLSQAIGDVRPEPGLEIVLGGTEIGPNDAVRVLGADFNLLASRVLPAGQNLIRVIADVDSDGANEIYASAGATLYALDGNLNTLWSHTYSAVVTDAIASDLDGDGRIELLVSSAGTLHVYRAPAIGDINCDGVVDFGDINPFVLLLTNPWGYWAQYPLCDDMNGDINCDGTIGFGDINPFVQLLSGGH